MIQSYGPAWFKMWSLELKERPERLPVVLGEVTADPVLLAQADDPRIQSALLPRWRHTHRRLRFRLGCRPRRRCLARR